MNAALVKIDVAAHILRQPVPLLFQLADGGDLIHDALMWVFDLSNGTLRSVNDCQCGSHRRDLRFWEPELQARSSADVSKHRKYCGWELDWVITKILPEKRVNFQAGEIDQLFQIRHNTRRELLDPAGMTAGRNFYSRAELAEFLKRRWLPNLGLATKSNFPKRNITNVDSGLTLVENEAGSASASPRATAQADTNKQTIHAGQFSKL